MPVSIYVCIQVKRATLTRLLSVYQVNASDGQSSSSSSPSSSAAAAAAVYDTSNVDQVTVTVDHISFRLPYSISASADVYYVLLQTGNNYNNMQ